MIVPEFNILKILIILVSVLCTSVIAFSATYTVTNTNDDGAAGSLRWAIDEVNTNPDPPDQIVFNIPGRGPHTITLLDELYISGESVLIDGYTQPGAAPADLQIELNGENLFVDNKSCLVLDASYSTIRGLVINRCGDTGIFINNYIGWNIIEDNYIGTDVKGTRDLGNWDDGVRIWGSPYNTIVGNVILGAPSVIQESNNGVEILRPEATNNLVMGNNIGIDAYGRKALGNLAFGVQIKEGAGGNRVWGNNIAGNGNIGIYLDGNWIEGGSHLIITDNNIAENIIGTKTGGEVNYATGIRLEYSENNIFNENTVAGSGWNGFQIRHLSNNNKFYDNTAILNPGNGFRVGLSSNDNEFIENIAIKNGRNGFSVGANIEEEGYQVSSNNIFTENTAQRNGDFGFFDQTTDGETLGTANTYFENMCEKNKLGGADPPGLCSPQP